MWLGEEDSNLHRRLQRPLSCRWTIPQEAGRSRPPRPHGQIITTAWRECKPFVCRVGEGAGAWETASPREYKKNFIWLKDCAILQIIPDNP